MFYFNIFLPYNYKYNIIENKQLNNIINLIYIYIYSEYIFINITINVDINNKKIFVNNNTNIIKLSNFKNDKIKTINNEFYKFLFSLKFIYFRKIKFTGKGFKIKKKKNNLILYFNTAHINLFINNTNILYRLNKSKYILLNSNLKYLIFDSLLLKSVRVNNIFTKRGLRLTRQLIIKKKGKN